VVEEGGEGIEAVTQLVSCRMRAQLQFSAFLLPSPLALLHWSGGGVTALDLSLASCLVPRHLSLFQSSAGGVLWCSIYDTHTRPPSDTHTHTPRVLRMDTPTVYLSLSHTHTQYFTVNACISLMCGMYARMCARMRVRARDE